MSNGKDERYYKAYMEHKTISRRGLLRSLAGGGKKVKQEMEKPAIARLVARPPYALEEVLFHELCTGCGECVSACPEFVIEIEAGKAQLNVDYGYCSQCGKCSEVCESGALSGLSPDTWLRPQFLKSCQSLLSGHCQLCSQACPHGAITNIANRLPSLDSHLCDGCGRCKQACPFSAIQFNLRQP